MRDDVVLSLRTPSAQVCLDACAAFRALSSGLYRELPKVRHRADDGGDPPQHLRRYAYDLCKLHELHKPGHWMVLLAVAQARDESGQALISPAMREALMAQIGCGPSGLTSLLAECVAANVLEQLDAQTYRLRRDFFGNRPNDPAHRAPKLVMVITYGPEGRTLVSARQLTRHEQQQLAVQASLTRPPGELLYSKLSPT